MSMQLEAPKARLDSGSWVRMECGKAAGFEGFRLRFLSVCEVTSLAGLEEVAWPVRMRASEQAFRDRAALGHRFLVAEGSEGLIAAVCYTFTSLDPHDAASFPATHRAFSRISASLPVVSAYVYNLCVHPAHRGGRVVHDLLRAGVEDCRRQGVRYIVGDGRCPSFAGSGRDECERFRYRPEVRGAIAQWIEDGHPPPDQVLQRDPMLRFYQRSLGCRFLRVMPDFCPEDTASGGHMIIFVKDL